MSRIGEQFAALRAQGRTGLIPYVTAGDPDPQTSVALLHSLVAAGADLVELGVPFSDPQADGPVIQDACQRALAHGVTLADVLDMVSTFRRDDTTTPVVVMGYLNPIEQMGAARFAERAGAAGVDGVIIVDAPPEESDELIEALVDAGIDPIFLVAPTTADERMQRIAQRARGFLYYVSLKGVTGAANLPVDEVAEKLRTIRGYTDLPIGVGFGIRDADSAAQVGRVADAVVVGSAVVGRIAEHPGDTQAITQAVRELVGSMRTALDAAA